MNRTSSQFSRGYIIALTATLSGSTITRASRVEPLRGNLKAVEIMPKLTPEVMNRIDDVFGIKREEEED